ncbi:MAG: Rieske 2Fe-2S domain-containing protein [Candidatus Eisenbacteria bacterium]
MTTDPSRSTSRLDPEPIERRDFLGMLASWSALAALAFAFVGAIRLPKAAVLPSPSKKFKVSIPESLAPNTAFVPPGRPVAVFRDRDGVHAVSLICTHLGCIVKCETEAFVCPCHGSQYKLDGTVTRGPAPKSLPWLAVSMNGDEVVVDEGTIVPQGTKVKA